MTTHNTLRDHLVRTVVTALVGVGLAVPAALAQGDFPNRPITFIVPFSAGSSNDTRSRIIAPRLSEILGQPVLVENVPGGGAVIGLAKVASSEPDGYTYAFTAGAITLLPSVRTSIPWDPIKDFVPVSIIGGSIFGVAVYNELPVESLAELIAYAKARPGELNASVSGNSSRMATHLFEINTGIDVEHVSYSGTGNAVNALISGEVDLTILDSAAFIPVLDTGLVRVIAIANEDRIDTYPDVPTTLEQGVDFVAGSTFGVYAPGGTPAEVVAAMNAALVEAVNDPKVLGQMTDIGLTIAPRDVEASLAFYRNELETNRVVVKEANIPVTD